MANLTPEPGNGGTISGQVISPPAPVEITTGFTYLADPHEYRLDGVRLPSVTEIVNSVSAGQNWATEWHLDRGSKVHRAIALMLAGRLDWAALDPRICGRVEAAKKAIKELDLAEYDFLEKPMNHPLYRFAGTPDLVARNILVDFKSGHYPLTTQPQLGGYALLLEAQKYKIKTCLEIVLNDTGKYQVHEYRPARCEGLFRAYLTVFHFQNNGRRAVADRGRAEERGFLYREVEG